MDITLTEEEWTALVHFARLGANTSGQLQPISSKVYTLNTFLKDIETRNGLKRYSLWIRWQEVDTPLPASTNFPDTWPPTQQYFLEQVGRPISRADVDRKLSEEAKNPEGVMVTKDVGATVGWTKLEDYFR